MTLSIDEFLNVLKEAQAIAILRTPTPGKAGPAMEAAVRGGFRVIEFTLNTPGALELIEEFSAKPNLLVGAGTVLTEGEAEEAIAAPRVLGAPAGARRSRAVSGGKRVGA